MFNTLSNSPIPTYWQDANHNDPLAEAEAIATNAYSGSYSRFASFRLGNNNSVYTPYGNNVDTDFYYQLYKIEDSNYISMLAFDIRSDRVFTISKVNGVWQGWSHFQFANRFTDTSPILTPNELLNWARIESRSGVFSLFARFSNYTTQHTFAEGEVIGRLKPEYYPTSGGFPVNVYNFANGQHYMLQIETDGYVKIYGIGSQTIFYDFYINATYEI